MYDLKLEPPIFITASETYMHVKKTSSTYRKFFKPGSMPWCSAAIDSVLAQTVTRMKSSRRWPRLLWVMV